MYFSSNPQFRTIVLKIGISLDSKESLFTVPESGSSENGSYRLYQREGFYEFELQIIQLHSHLRFSLTVRSQ